MRDDELARLLDEPVDWRFKGRPATRESITLGTFRERRWNVLGGDFLLPVLVLKERALDHNIQVVADYCREHAVSLAPHGKTSMAPQLFKRQLDAGAWGMTAATVSQVGVYRRFGVSRIVLANELVDGAGLRWIADELASDPGFDFYCLVDSVAGVDAMTAALAGATVGAPLQVLVELGVTGGRSGCRTLEEAKEVAVAASASPALALAGVEGFEGVIADPDVDVALGGVNEFLTRLRALATELAHDGAFAARDEIIVTAGGSAFFDRVVACLGPPWDLRLPVRLVLRGGCYASHDSGFYERLSPLGGRREDGRRLHAALEAWGVVLSRPEPDLAIVGVGKRDVPFDIDLPIPQRVSRSGTIGEVYGKLVVAALNDQHAFVRLGSGARLDVGDLVGFGISHPCLAFDRWALIPLVDDDYTVVGAVRTFF